MITTFRPCGRTTGIGSLPHADVNKAVELSLGAVDIPFWPQLPKRNFRELMNVQYSEGMPSLKLDEEKRKIWFEIDDNLPEELTAFYERYLEGDAESFAVSREYAEGLYAFLDRLRQLDSRFAMIKGQVTGPITFAFGVTDKDLKAVYYYPDLLDAVVKCLALKATWQVDLLAQHADRVLMFLDEPALAAFGTSAYPSLTAQDVQSLLNEVAEVVHGRGALVGVHCCGNTDWEMLTQADLDVISFDAYQYAESLSLYPDAVIKFLERGGVLAWGIVPTSEDVLSESVESLSEKLFDSFTFLEKKGAPADRLREQCLLTPSCGAGTMEVSAAERVFELLSEMGRWAKESFACGHA